MHVVHAAGLEREDDFREVEPPDLGRFLRGAVGVFGLGPEAQAMAGGGASGAARALVGGGAADLFDEQRVDAAIGIEPGDARLAGVDDEAHAVDGERGFGDVGADDDFPLARITRHGGVLVGGRQFAVERQREPPTQTRVIADFAQGAVDLVRAGHEHERVAFRVGGGEPGQFLGGEFPRGDAVERRGAGEVFDVHRVGAAPGDERFAGREVFAPARRFPAWPT